MTKEKQRIVIAEFCGAKHVQFLGKKAWTFESYPNPENLLCPMEHGGCLIDVPNYPEDLNAMAGAIDKLSIGQRTKWPMELRKIIMRDCAGNENPDTGIVDDTWFYNAIAAQRSEAFIKTIGRWKE